MTIQEIKDVFNIDITEKNRTDLYVYFRTLYVKNNTPKTSINQLSKELNRTHSTLLHNLKKLDIYNLDPLFMYVIKAFKSKDIALVHEYKRLHRERIKERTNRNYKAFVAKQNLHKPKRLTKEKYVGEEDRISLDFLDAERVGIFEVAENLRFKNTKLNDKPLPEWTGRDWKNYHKLINN